MDARTLLNNPGGTLQIPISKRVQALENLRIEWAIKYYEELVQMGPLFGVIGNSMTMDAVNAHRFIAGQVPFVDDGDDVVGNQEFVRRPEALMRRGGDCEDINLFLMGGILSARHGQDGFGSVYLPDLVRPGHVTLAVLDAGSQGWMVFDATPPGQIYPLEANVAVLEWEQGDLRT